MNPPGRTASKPMVVGACLALLAILLGFTLGGAFGLVEGTIKKHLDDSGSASLQSAYAGDVAAKNAVVAKSWVYLQRAHLHGGAIGAAALASILAMILLARPGTSTNVSALAFGAGAILYPLFWLLAGLTAPAAGSTGAAKESLTVIAIPGAGLCILGLCGTIFSIAKACFFGPTAD